MKRANIAAINGWRVMRFRPDEIQKNPKDVINQIIEALNYTEEE